LAESSSLYLREQFSTPEQQRETATLGMWIFIVTEMMLFGGLFAAFAGFHHWYPSGFTKGSSEMEYLLGSINTAVLICSGLTMSLAEYSAAQGKIGRCIFLILITVLIGAAFLGVKFTEYYLHYKDHKLPGFGFQEPGSQMKPVQMFFFFYFVMTGLHSIHLIIGIGLALAMLVPLLDGSISEKYHTPIDNVSLYWHFVDVIWVFLYAIFYVPGAHLR
jgi:cytochrome c oxidase subunit III